MTKDEQIKGELLRLFCVARYDIALYKRNTSDQAKQKIKDELDVLADHGVNFINAIINRPGA